MPIHRAGVGGVAYPQRLKFFPLLKDKVCGRRDYNCKFFALAALTGIAQQLNKLINLLHFENLDKIYNFSPASSARLYICVFVINFVIVIPFEIYPLQKNFLPPPFSKSWLRPWYLSIFLTSLFFGACEM